MEEKFYAVRSGNNPGIYKTWAECSREVTGVKGAVYKSFKTLEEAEKFMRGEIGYDDRTGKNTGTAKKTDAANKISTGKQTETENPGNRQRQTGAENEESLISPEDAGFDYIAYTDGGCIVNPGGAGGYGAVIIKCSDGSVTELSGGFKSTTNNRMEILAAVKAFESLPAGVKVKLYADSQYVLNTLSGKWKRNANTDLWQMLDAAIKGKSFTLSWVKGHNKNRFNERCDRLAFEAYSSDDLNDDKGYAGQD